MAQNLVTEEYSLYISNLVEKSIFLKVRDSYTKKTHEKYLKYLVNQML